MITGEQYRATARGAVIDTAYDFHLKAVTNKGLHIAVPGSYQILEPGFRPYKAGKASPEELQQVLDEVVTDAEERGIDLGITGPESVQKLSLQLGLGIDCSNFAYRALSAIHERLELPPYTQTVFREAPEIKALYEKKGGWEPKTRDGTPRELTARESVLLKAKNSLLTVEWIARVFGKDPEFITGSQHICSSDAAVKVDTDELLPGDLIAFHKAGGGVVSHVAVIENVETIDDVVRASFWHSWHTRNFGSGLRRDWVDLRDGVVPVWSHDGLADTDRYQGHGFVRPKAMASLLALSRQTQ